MSIPDFSPYQLVLKPVPEFPGWFHGPVTEWEEAKTLAADLRPLPAARGQHVFVGALDDEGHRVYVTPLLTPREIVRVFGVGAQGGHSAASADQQIGKRLEKVQRLCPFIITFADTAGVHAEFTRPLTETIAAKIERLYADGPGLGLGLESYEASWDGEGSLMAPTLLAEQQLRLWWD